MLEFLKSLCATTTIKAPEPRIKVCDIPTDLFNEVLEQLLNSGWTKIYEYDNFDAWIDYGKVVVKKDGTRVVLEWTNWLEGEVEGPDAVLRSLGLSCDDRHTPG